ncbi:hypothetical protein VSH64_09065 [Amycolatopsis rhabdoformis]|uniref:DUF2218 domain-containing protein n=1 Tax=Amycolatopsis rhabdoformis TaxID=1448059 RepID=A0ABZ1IEY5_9PSEU|nr:hypothetical protein [Amycolatopsis rhabdoformis]WSE32258.1 hypothetical protein VSH64_09065 [Amycolatopsis rhabdoformis]
MKLREIVEGWAAFLEEVVAVLVYALHRSQDRLFSATIGRRDGGHDAAELILSQGPARFNLRGMDHALLGHIREELRTGLAAYETQRSPGAVWLVDATRPQDDHG